MTPGSSSPPRPGPRRRCSVPDAYPALHDKAAALLQSVVGNHALVDGNKRLGLGCASSRSWG